MMTPEERAERKAQIAAAQEKKMAMTIEEKIQFVNTPYSQLPEELKPGMTKNPQKFKFVRLSKPHLKDQQETFAARLIKYRRDFSMTREQFCEVANEYGRRAGIRITMRDLSNYEDFNICPKIDKMTLIARAMGVGIDYFAGYGSDRRKSNIVSIQSRKKVG